MMTISIEPVNAQAVSQALRYLPDKLQGIVKKSMRKSLRAGKSEARNRAKARYTLPASIVTKSLSYRVTGLSGELKSSGRRNVVEKARYKKVTRGIHATVVVGQGGLIARSFLNPRSGKPTQRLGPPRLPIKRIKTISAPGMVSHPTVAEPTADKIAQVLNTTILNEVSL